MTTQIFKTILAGVLFGAALFMIPLFLIKVLLFFLLIKLAFRLLGLGRNRRFAYCAQNMSDEDKQKFMKHNFNGCCRRTHRTNESTQE